MHIGVIYALLAALLFGASTPLAKLLIAQISPNTLAGLLYLGSGVGLAVIYLIRSLRYRSHAHSHEAGAPHDRLQAQDWPWLGAAILSGGVAAPVLLMLGLAVTPASSTSLLLNLEGVLTALLAWFVFKENFDRRILLGMLFIVAASAILSWEQRPQLGVPWGSLAIIGACLCWALDNNFTRKVAASDALQIAMLKGLIAGPANLALAWFAGGSLPAMTESLWAALLGFCSYGLSLVLFVMALRQLGTARTGAYFSAAPFVGASIALLLGEAASPLFWVATAFMGAGLWLHLSERHSHHHTHEFMEHAHSHTHDSHHQHAHDFDWDGTQPHIHSHQHQPMTHTHPHFPDIHHRHPH